MAGPIGLKLGAMGENFLEKECFGPVEVDRGQVSGPQVPLLGHGDDRDPKLGMMGLVDMKWAMMSLANIYKVARTESVASLRP